MLDRSSRRKVESEPRFLKLVLSTSQIDRILLRWCSFFLRLEASLVKVWCKPRAWNFAGEERYRKVDVCVKQGWTFWHHSRISFRNNFVVSVVRKVSFKSPQELLLQKSIDIFTYILFNWIYNMNLGSFWLTYSFKEKLWNCCSHSPGKKYTV